MKILLANKFYYRRGGDCVYVLNLEQLLKKHGHEVAVFAMDYPENVDTEWKRYFPQNMSNLMAFTRPFGSREVRGKFNRLLDAFRPDVVHLNNIHTQLSPVLADLAHKRGIKVVWTLHDYKLLCPRYDCLLNGDTVCEACFKGDKKACLDHKCMKGSKLASFVGFREANLWNRQRLEASTDMFVCPSRFMADKMAEGGFDEKKMVVLCNFIDSERCRRNNYDKGDYYCYIGRLSQEKGVKTLIEAANRLPYKMKVIGDGPLFGELKAIAHSHIEFLGHKDWDEIKVLVGQARFSVVPSEWYENNPLSVIEAQCLGTPVLGARIGGIPELTDKTFISGNVTDLKGKIEEMWNTLFDYQQLAEVSQRKYDAESYYNHIIKVYSK